MENNGLMPQNQDETSSGRMDKTFFINALKIRLFWIYIKPENKVGNNWRYDYRA